MIRWHQSFFLSSIIIVTLLFLFFFFLPLPRYYATGGLLGASSALLSLLILFAWGNKFEKKTEKFGIKSSIFINYSLRMIIYSAALISGIIFTQVFHYFGVLLGILMIKLILVIYYLIRKPNMLEKSDAIPFR